MERYVNQDIKEETEKNRRFGRSTSQKVEKFWCGYRRDDTDSIKKIKRDSFYNREKIEERKSYTKKRESTHVNPTI